MAIQFDIAAKAYAPELGSLVDLFKAATGAAAIDPTLGTSSWDWLVAQCTTRLNQLQITPAVETVPAVWDQARLYLILHTLALIRRGNQAVGPLTMERVGELARMYVAPRSQQGIWSTLGLSTWGMELRRLLGEQGIVGVYYS